LLGDPKRVSAFAALPVVAVGARVGPAMGALCCRLFRRKKETDYKKADEARTPDLEGGGVEWDDWDEFPEEEESARAPLAPGGPLPPAAPEPEAEPEPEPEPESDDPFAGFGMAPQIVKTKRHAARPAAASVWVDPAAPMSSRLQHSSLVMNAEPEAGGGWADDDLDLGDGERRRAAEEERRAQRKRDQAARKAAAAERVKAARSGAGARLRGT
jgi:hypothetical protein